MSNRVEQIEVLARRLASALAAVGAKCDGGALFRELAARYAEPQRHYHTLAHVDACLTWLDWFAGSAERPAEVELALWFHDAVYEPLRSDNEAASAALARARLSAAGADEDAVARIAAHVLATRAHTPETNDAALVIDADLAILAGSEPEYARFEQQIRLEFQQVPEHVYRTARAAVLRGFAARPRLYHVPALRELLERRARCNLETAIARLEGAHSSEPRDTH